MEIAVEILEQRGKFAKVDDRSEEEGCDVVRSSGGSQSWERRRTGLINLLLVDKKNLIGVKATC